MGEGAFFAFFCGANDGTIGGATGGGIGGTTNRKYNFLPHRNPFQSILGKTSSCPFKKFPL